MADVTLTYKGSDILELSASGSATLKTGGKYCEDDIAVEYVKPSGGGIDFIDVDEGEITVTSSGLTSLTINHNLGVVPFCVMVFPVTSQTVSGNGKHVLGGLTFCISQGSIPNPKNTSPHWTSNPTNLSKIGYYSEANYNTTSPDVEAVTTLNGGNYLKGVTNTDFSIMSSSAYPIESGITYRWRALAFNSNL